VGILKAPKILIVEDLRRKSSVVISYFKKWELGSPFPDIRPFVVKTR
jgi:hypothetical protein